LCGKRSDIMATETYPIIEGGTRPAKRLRMQQPNTKYPFRSMKVGDYFFVPGRSRNTLAPYASTMGKELGYKLRTQMCYMRESLEGWKPCDKAEPGAVLGIGVWRMS
jgi:hypothetical protein